LGQGEEVGIASLDEDAPEEGARWVPTYLRYIFLVWFVQAIAYLI